MLLNITYNYFNSYKILKLLPELESQKSYIDGSQVVGQYGTINQIVNNHLSTESYDLSYKLKGLDERKYLLDFFMEVKGNIYPFMFICPRTQFKLYDEYNSANLNLKFENNLFHLNYHPDTFLYGLGMYLCDGSCQIYNIDSLEEKGDYIEIYINTSIGEYLPKGYSNFVLFRYGRFVDGDLAIDYTNVNEEQMLLDCSVKIVEIPKSQ